MGSLGEVSSAPFPWRTNAETRYCSQVSVSALLNYYCVASHSFLNPFRSFSPNLNTSLCSDFIETGDAIRWILPHLSITPRKPAPTRKHCYHWLYHGRVRAAAWGQLPHSNFSPAIKLFPLSLHLCFFVVLFVLAYRWVFNYPLLKRCPLIIFNLQLSLTFLLYFAITSLGRST